MSLENREEIGKEEKDPNVIRVLIGLPHEGMTGSEAYCNRLNNFKHLGHWEERGRLLKESPRFEFFQKTITHQVLRVIVDRSDQPIGGAGSIRLFRRGLEDATG